MRSGGRFSAVVLPPLAALVAALSACSGGSTPVTSPSPTATATPDPSALLHRYVTTLTADLAGWQPVDGPCSGSDASCRSAVDADGAVGARVMADMQKLPAEPGSANTPVEEIRRDTRFLPMITQNFDAGSMSRSEVVVTLDGMYRQIENDLKDIAALAQG